ncbi:MAG: rRNA pseudouridine synthase [Clostridia bacterium]|nr:rRNA pseudouridine synthase [Clostridia bacterium]
MADKDKPRIRGERKKPGDFSKFIKKKSTPAKPGKPAKPGRPSKSAKTARLIGDRFRDEEQSKKAPHSKAPADRGRRRTRKVSEYVKDGGSIRLNKYIANAGICSRREADNLIVSGAVQVNGVVVSVLGSKVNPTDKVQIGGDTLTSEKHRYVLLNKPKGYITTTDDPADRRTVMMLVENACKERIYPVGRLDRNTLGLLLFTNDGDLAKKLTHPASRVRKIYHVQTDQPVRPSDLEAIANGIQLDDGLIKPDAVSYVGDGKDKKEIGIELHSGKNRIVRRIFESLGYSVNKLDRVFFAGLTKKDLPRGRWRHLTPDEINFLRMV